MGFLGPVRNGMIEQLGLALDNRGNIATTNYMSSREGVFAAGDMRRGQSLVVWAIAEGRKAAAAVNEYLAAKEEPLPRARHSAAVNSPVTPQVPQLCHPEGAAEGSAGVSHLSE